MSSETKQPAPDAGTQRESDIYDVLAWLEVNKKRVAIVAVVLVLIGFALSTLRYMKQQKEEKASGALLALKPTLTPQTNVPPPQASALLKVAQDYSGTSAAERARLLAASQFFTEGRYAEAEKEFSQFVRDFPGSPWVAQAAYGVAASQEAQNKVSEAQSAYQNVAAAYANSSVADDAKLALGRIYESQKKPDQALRIYNELMAPKPGMAPGQGGNPQAYSRKESLLRAHPELNTNLLARPLPAPVLQPATNAAPPATNAAPITSAPAAQGTNAPEAK